jgi:hypothetical protein
MFTLKVSDVFRALARTWFGWVAIILLLILVGGCVWAFSAGNIVLGVLLALASIAYFFALVYLLYYALVLGTILGTFLSLILRGLFGRF